MLKGKIEQSKKGGVDQMGDVTGGRLVVDALKREGVEYIFSLSGGHIDSIYQACLDVGIKVIDTRHEQAAAHMAEAWGRLTRKPGVCVVTAGPGFTDAITGVANAFMANSPMIFIAGRSGVSQTETLSLQELEQIDIIRPLVKWARVVYEAHRLDEFTAIAFRHALTGRPGPVFLEIPMDIIGRKVEEKEVIRPDGYRPRCQPGASIDGLNEAMAMLRKAKKPVIIAGSGAYYADAGEELKTFCELTKVPVFTKFTGRGVLPDNDPYCPGSLISGMAILPQSDLVLIFGARLDFMMLYGRPPIIPEMAELIQVDIEGSEIGRNRKVDLGLVGDVKEVLKGMIELAVAEPFSHSEWLESVRPQANDSKQLMIQGLLASQKEEPIHPARLMKEINDFLEDDAVVVADGGDTQVWTMFMRDVYQPGHFLSSGNFGCLGVGIPFGLAAKLRYPDKQVLVTMGDGSAGLNIMEFHTAVRFGLPIVMVIFNDCSWGMIRHGQKQAFGQERLVGCELGEVSYEKVVEALGGYGERVNRADEIRPALERAFASQKPACLNVYTDMDVGSPLGGM
jgi:acetolactate synthase-1/2/3 large subunit